MEPYAKDARERLVKEAQEIISCYPEGHAHPALLPMLYLVQFEDGYVSSNGIELCAELLGLNPAEVSAMVAFYTQYRRRPNGEYIAGVCVNSLCVVMGGDEIWDTVCEYLGVGYEETTTDGKITLEVLKCNAACDYAPVIMVNWESFDNQTPESAVELVDDLWADNPVGTTRGPKQISTFRENEHLLAGFEDGHADEGASTGDATLLGKRVAESHGWGIPADLGWSIPEKEGETQ